jgi:hypothetical protein
MADGMAQPRDDRKKIGQLPVGERMAHARRHRKFNPTGPYSRKLLNGIRDAYNGRSRDGRYVAALEAALVAHCGGEPLTITQRLLIERIIRLQMQLVLLDEKFAAGETSWTAHDMRTFSGISNAFKNAIRELGFRPAKAQQPTLAEHLDRLAQQSAGR